MTAARAVERFDGLPDWCQVLIAVIVYGLLGWLYWWALVTF